MSKLIDAYLCIGTHKMPLTESLVSLKIGKKWLPIQHNRQKVFSLSFLIVSNRRGSSQGSYYAWWTPECGTCLGSCLGAVDRVEGGEGRRWLVVTAYIRCWETHMHLHQGVDGVGWRLGGLGDAEDGSEKIK